MFPKLSLLLLSFLGISDNHAQVIKPIDYIKMSKDFVYTAKTEEDASLYMDSFAVADEEDLFQQLITENDKKAFFINLYNAYTQVILKKDPDKFKNRSEFFKAEQITFASHQISLDKIEHGLLRRSRVKWSLGYFGKLFPGKLERKFRIEKVDYRIHFSLNCGATSCPAIAFYEPDKLEEQLEMATKAYLSGEAEYIKETNTLYLPVLMNWFRGDFGGKKNILKLCQKLDILPDDVKPKIEYKIYNWDLYLNNYKD